MGKAKIAVLLHLSIQISSKDILSKQIELID